MRGEGDAIRKVRRNLAAVRVDMTHLTMRKPELQRDGKDKRDNENGREEGGGIGHTLA